MQVSVEAAPVIGQLERLLDGGAEGGDHPSWER